MSNVDNQFMDRFRQRPLEEQLKVFKQNLKQLQEEEAVDLSDLITDCKAQIRQLKKTITNKIGEEIYHR